MIERHKQGKLTWVDVQNPSSDEIHELLIEFGIDPTLLTDIGVPGIHQDATMHGKAIKVILAFPVVKRTDMTRPHEIKFIIQKNILISIRYEDIEAIHRFEKEFEVISMLYKAKKDATGAHLFFALMREITLALSSKLDYLEAKMSDIEKEIFDGHEKDTVFTLSEVSRRLTSFRQAIRPHAKVLNDVKIHLNACFNAKIADEIDAIFDQQEFLMRRDRKSVV